MKYQKTEQENSTPTNHETEHSTKEPKKETSPHEETPNGAESTFTFIKHVMTGQGSENDAESEDEIDNAIRFGGTHHRGRWIILIVSLCMVVLIGVLVLVGCNDAFALFKSDGEKQQITIPPGASVSDVSTIFQEHHMISQPFVFELYAKATGEAGKIKAGTFELHSGMSYAELLQQISNSANNLAKGNLTIPEGTDLFQLTSLPGIAAISDGEQLLHILNDPVVYGNYGFASYLEANQLAQTYYPMEGFVCADTFAVDTTTTSATMAQTILSETDQLLQPFAVQAQQKGMGLYEVVTLASIIQAEAGSTDDMPLISSVLHNRLSDSSTYPKLQCDPTRKYAEKVAADLQKSGNTDSALPDSYNTYTCNGLPAGPICTPGVDALNAALNPADTQYTYFCANPNTKECFYATTNEEHEQNLVKAGIQ